MTEIRCAELSDEEALAALDRAAWSTFSSPGPVPADGVPFFDERTDPADVLVAVVDDVVAGYVRLGRASRFASSDHVLTINGIAVGTAWRRRGVGRALLEEAAAEAQRRGARRLTLRVFGPNLAARRLYDSAGFVVEGVLHGEFFLGGEYVDDVVMARSLDET